MTMMTTMRNIRALISKLTMFRNRRSYVMLAGSRHNWQLHTSHQYTELFSPLVCGGAAFFLAIGAASSSVGGSVAVAYLAIGRTLRKSPRKFVGLLGLDCKSEGIPWYTNSPMMVFVSEGTVVAIDGRFVKFQVFFVDNICQALPADQLENSGVVARFCKLSIKTPNI